MIEITLQSAGYRMKTDGYRLARDQRSADESGVDRADREKRKQSSGVIVFTRSNCISTALALTATRDLKRLALRACWEVHVYIV